MPKITRKASCKFEPTYLQLLVIDVLNIYAVECNRGSLLFFRVGMFMYCGF
jgi:hypothetical protein